MRLKMTVTFRNLSPSFASKKFRKVTVTPLHNFLFFGTFILCWRNGWTGFL